MPTLRCGILGLFESDQLPSATVKLHVNKYAKKQILPTNN